MNQSEKIESIAQEVGESITEVIDTARAVRGEKFADAVSAVFNLHSIVKALAILTSISTDKAQAKAISESAIVGVASVCSALLEPLANDVEREEAMKMATSLHERGEEAQQKISAALG